MRLRDFATSFVRNQLDIDRHFAACFLKGMYAFWSLGLAFRFALLRFTQTVDGFWHAYLDAYDQTLGSPMLWHKYIAAWPMETMEGVREHILWRRRRPDGQWEYTVRHESPADLADRM